MEPKFAIDKTFEASQQVVFNAFSKEEHLCNWWGSIPFDLVLCDLDFGPGGRFHYGLVSPNFKMYGVFDYLDIDEPNMISFLNYFSDKNGNLERHPMSETWPMRMRNIFSFKPMDEKTSLHIEVTAYQANNIEMKTFKEGIPSLEAGFKGTLDKLEKYLETLPKD